MIRHVFSWAFLGSFLLTSPVSSLYLKDLDEGEVKERLLKKGGQSYTLNKKSREKSLLKNFPLKKTPDSAFVTDIDHVVDQLMKVNETTVFKEDIPYDTAVKVRLMKYFKLTKNKKKNEQAKNDFKEALELIKKRHKAKRKDRNLDCYTIVTKLEQSAESGYLPALSAYGLLNRYGLLGLKKNIPLAEAFFKIAAESGDDVGMRYLGKLRHKHYVLDDTLTKSTFVKADRIPEMKNWRAAALGEGNFSKAAKNYYQTISKDVQGKRAKTIVKTAGVAVDGMIDRISKLTAAAKSGAAVVTSVL